MTGPPAMTHPTHSLTDEKVTLLTIAESGLILSPGGFRGRRPTKNTQTDGIQLFRGVQSAHMGWKPTWPLYLAQTMHAVAAKYKRYSSIPTSSQII